MTIGLFSGLEVPPGIVVELLNLKLPQGIERSLMLQDLGIVVGAGVCLRIGEREKPSSRSSSRELRRSRITETSKCKLRAKKEARVTNDKPRYGPNTAFEDRRGSVFVRSHCALPTFVLPFCMDSEGEQLEVPNQHLKLSSWLTDFAG